MKMSTIRRRTGNDSDYLAVVLFALVIAAIIAVNGWGDLPLGEEPVAGVTNPWVTP